MRFLNFSIIFRAYIVSSPYKQTNTYNNNVLDRVNLVCVVQYHNSNSKLGIITQKQNNSTNIPTLLLFVPYVASPDVPLKFVHWISLKNINNIAQYKYCYGTIISILCNLHITLSNVIASQDCVD